MDVDKIDSGSNLTPPRSRKATPPPPGFVEAEGKITPEEQIIRTAIFMAKMLEAEASDRESTTCVSSIGEEDQPPPLFLLFSMLTPTSTPTPTPTSISKSNCTFAFLTTPFDKDRHRVQRQRQKRRVQRQRLWRQKNILHSGKRLRRLLTKNLLHLL